MPQHTPVASAITGCARQAGSVVACHEVVARLTAAQRDARVLGVDTSTLRRNAERISRVHLDELATHA